MADDRKCNYCDAHFFIKVMRYTKPLFAPLTEAQALKYKLIDLTGEDYVEIECNFCPVCGKKIDWNNLKRRCK